MYNREEVMDPKEWVEVIVTLQLLKNLTINIFKLAKDGWEPINVSLFRHHAIISN